jgi:hypothetical protein
MPRQDHDDLKRSREGDGPTAPRTSEHEHLARQAAEWAMAAQPPIDADRFWAGAARARGLEPLVRLGPGKYIGQDRSIRWRGADAFGEPRVSVRLGAAKVSVPSTGGDDAHRDAECRRVAALLGIPVVDPGEAQPETEWLRGRCAAAEKTAKDASAFVKAVADALRGSSDDAIVDDIRHAWRRYMTSWTPKPAAEQESGRVLAEEAWSCPAESSTAFAEVRRALDPERPEPLRPPAPHDPSSVEAVEIGGRWYTRFTTLAPHDPRLRGAVAHVGITYYMPHDEPQAPDPFGPDGWCIAARERLSVEPCMVCGAKRLETCARRIPKATSPERQEPPKGDGLPLTFSTLRGFLRMLADADARAVGLRLLSGIEERFADPGPQPPPEGWAVRPMDNCPRLDEQGGAERVAWVRNRGEGLVLECVNERGETLAAPIGVARWLLADVARRQGGG